MPNTINNVTHYDSNYITNVIFRVDFPNIIELDIREPTAEFQRRIVEKFPRVNPLKRDLVNFQIQPNEVKTGKEEEYAWEFFNKENNKKIFLTSDHASIEYFNHYTRFKELLDDIELVFKAIFELYPVKIAERVGLRYINQIEMQGSDVYNWENLINKHLYSLTDEFTSENDEVQRSMHLLEVNEEGHSLKFQFGLFNSDYPNTISRKEFVLDYDCSTTQPTDVSEVSNLAEKFNVIIYKWFDKSIENGLKEKMGVQNAT